MNRAFKGSIGILPLLLALSPIAAGSDQNGDWEFGASIYGWFPDISGRTAIALGGGADFEVEVGDILDNLQFTLQGSFDARKGRWGLYTDVIYMDLGRTESIVREGEVSRANLPADVSAAVGFDLKSLIWSTAGYYRMIDEPGRSFDVLMGLRYSDIEQSLDWTFSGNIEQLPIPGRQGRVAISADLLDVIIGIRGQFAFGGNHAWFIPLYVDLGTGDSDFTWQAVTGLGYSFRWGQIAAVWRQLDYDLSSGKPISELQFSGPAAGVVFRW